MANIPKTQNLYEKLLIMQMLNYKKQGYSDIRVNHKNYLHGQPDMVGGFTPAISAVRGNKTVICEIDMKDLVEDKIQQWQAFGRSSCEFHLLVSTQSFDEVKDVVKNNGINVDKYWYCGNY